MGGPECNDYNKNNIDSLIAANHSTMLANLKTTIGDNIYRFAGNKASVATATGALDAKLDEYSKQIAALKCKIGDLKGNHTTVLTRIGALRNTTIPDLEREKKQAEEDNITAIARKEAVDTSDKKVSYHQLFGGISRPLQLISIPILLTLCILFCVVGGVFIYLIYGGSGSAASAVNTGLGNILYGGSAVLRRKH
jgi:hypothetical protein